MTHLLFLQRDHTNSKQTKTAFYRRRPPPPPPPRPPPPPARAPPPPPLLTLPPRLAAPRALALRASPPRPTPWKALAPPTPSPPTPPSRRARPRPPPPNPRQPVPHRCYPPTLARNDPLNRRLCLPPHDHPNHPCPPNHRGRRDRPHAPILDDRSPPVRENLHAP